MNAHERPQGPGPIYGGTLSSSGVDVDMTEEGFVTTFYRERVESRKAIPTLSDCPNCGEPFTRILEDE